MMKTTKDAVEILDRMVGDDVDLRAMIDEERMNAEVAGLVYRARTAARLTQAQLAKLVRTTQPNIARLEDADYRGHSLTMLRRIAAALHMRLELRFLPRRKRKTNERRCGAVMARNCFSPEAKKLSQGKILRSGSTSRCQGRSSKAQALRRAESTRAEIRLMRAPHARTPPRSCRGPPRSPPGPSPAAP